VPVISQPETPAQLTISASASEPISVRLSGLARDSSASGTALELYPIFETYVVAGTGASVTSNTFSEIHTIEKTADSTAELTFSVAGKTIARIAPEQRIPEYRRIEWLYLPPAGRVLRVEYFKRPERIASESSHLPVESDFDYLLWRVVGDMHWLANESEPARIAWQKADGIMQEKILADTAADGQFHQIRPNLTGYGHYGQDLI
jgi:hypothetical protein